MLLRRGPQVAEPLVELPLGAQDEGRNHQLGTLCVCVCGRRLDGCAVVGLQQPPILASGSSSEAEDLKKLDDS